MIYVLILVSKVRETCSFIKLNKRFKLDKTSSNDSSNFAG